jgi:hypothetical protein
MKTKTVRSKIVAAVEGPITSRQASLLDQRFTELRTKFGKLTADLVWRGMGRIVRVLCSSSLLMTQRPLPKNMVWHVHAILSAR